MTPRASAVPLRTLTADSQLMQDYLATAGILVNPDCAPAVAAFQNPDGESEAVVIDVNGNACHVCREPLSDSGWNMYGLGAGFNAIGAVDSASLWALGGLDASIWLGSHGRWTSAAGELASGQLPAEIAVGTDGTVWALDASGVAYVKGASTSQAPPAASLSVTPVAVRDASGRLHLFCVDTHGQLWTIGQEAPGGGWGTWTTLGAPDGVSLGAVAVVPSPSDGLDVFAVAADGAVWWVVQPGPGQPWSPWSSIGAPSGVALSCLAVALNPDAQPEVFASGSTGDLWTIAQTVPGGGWTAWQSLGALSLFSITAIAVTAAANGALVVFVAGAGLQPLASIGQTGPGGGWGQWTSLGSELLAGKIDALAVALEHDGCLDVFALENLQGEPVETGVWHCTQQAPNGNWGGWNPLGAPGDGMQLGPIAVGRNADGRLELFATGSDGALWHCWQATPGSGWGLWASLAVPGAAPLGAIAVTRDQAGCLQAFGLDSSPKLWLIQQMAAGAGWGNWVSAWWSWAPLGGPALQHAPSGRGNDCWAVAASGSLACWNGSA